MSWIKKDLKEIIMSYIEKGDFTKPLMIVAINKNGSSNPVVDDCRSWMKEELNAFIFQGHPLQGHNHLLIDGKVEAIQDHPELLDSTLIPSGAEKAPVLIYHRYLQQMELQYLEYVIALGRMLEKPIVCLINDYCYDEYKEKKINYNLSDFEMVMFNCEMTKSDWDDWLEWCSEQKKIIPEIIAFVKKEIAEYNDPQKTPWIVTQGVSPRQFITLNSCFLNERKGYKTLSSGPKEDLISIVWACFGFRGRDISSRFADFVYGI